MAGRVQLIKDRFEKLETDLEPLDVSTLRIKKQPKAYFQRSATCIDFSKLNLNENGKTTTEAENQVPKQNRFHQFQRQSSNSSTSSNKSIRRSPAFRLEKHNKPSLKPSKVQPKDPVIAKPAIDLIIDEAEYLRTSETIKKALKNPLPLGPPPKKPPRTFDSPIKDISIVEELEKRSIEMKPVAEQPQLQHKIHFLENNLKITSKTLPQPRKSSKSEEKNSFGSFLKCIAMPCQQTDSIYYDRIDTNCYDKPDDEQIYMEPFQHLHNKDWMNNKCNPKNDELHYMYTVLNTSDNNGNCSSATQSPSNQPELNNYDKINLLINVVFDENTRDNIIDESSQSPSESSVAKRRISRSLTEKRKNYVRRMTQSIKMQQEDKVQTYGSLKRYTEKNESPLSASDRISQFQNLINANSPDRKLEKELKIDNEEKLFQMCLLAGFDASTNKSYIKSCFPKDATLLPMLEEFIYPSKNLKVMTKEDQNFCLVLTDETGSHLYGYCRQVLPEDSEICLPLTYCLISHVKASGFYFNVLKEIEARHGQSETQFGYLLKNLQSLPLPKSGKILHLKLLESPRPKTLELNQLKKTSKEIILKSNTKFCKRLSLESPPPWLTESATIQMNSALKELESSTKPDLAPFDLGLINRSLFERFGHNGNTSKDYPKTDEILIRRPNDLRLENAELSVLYECTTNELLTILFGTLLIERKVILLSRSISKLSSCILALQSILYPFQWQHTIITVTPDNLNEIIQAPLPILVGMFKDSVNITTLEVEDGIAVDIDTKTILMSCNDETTLLPDSLKKSLMLSLKIVELMDEGKMLKNVLIAEAFLQFFVKLFSNLNAKMYEKDKFIDSHNDQTVKFFLEWFLETAMFKEFLNQKANYDCLKLELKDETKEKSNKKSLTTYYDLFNTKVLEKSETYSDGKNRYNSQQMKNVEILLKSSKQLNRKQKNFKNRIRDFLNN